MGIALSGPTIIVGVGSALYEFPDFSNVTVRASLLAIAIVGNLDVYVRPTVALSALPQTRYTGLLQAPLYLAVLRTPSLNGQTLSFTSTYLATTPPPAQFYGHFPSGPPWGPGESPPWPAWGVGWASQPSPLGTIAAVPVNGVTPSGGQQWTSLAILASSVGCGDALTFSDWPQVARGGQLTC